MRALRSAHGLWNLVYLVSSSAVTGAVAVACSAGYDGGSVADPESAPKAGETGGELPVVAQFQGYFDGQKMWVKAVPVDTAAPAAAPADDGIGTVQQALETDIANDFFDAGTTQTNFILIDQLAFHNQTTWDTTHCGPTPTRGSCVDWKFFSAFADQDLFRGYFYISTITPTTGVSVGFAPVGADTDTATPDPGLLGVTGLTGNFGSTPGMWRLGLLERTGQEARASERWLAFVGTPNGSGAWTFSWQGQVRGALVRPTVRGSLVNGTMDQAPFYTANGTAQGGMALTSSIQATSDARYVVFSSSASLAGAPSSPAGTKVYRYDTTTGATTLATLSTGGTLPSGCSAIYPSISNDGSRVVFQSSGCDLGFGTTGRQIYLRDITAGTTTLVTHVPGNPGTASGDAQMARIAGGGGHVTFVSNGQIFAGRPATRSSAYDVYRYTIASDTMERANVPTSGAGTWPNISQFRPDISSDGSRVVFDTAAQILVPGDGSVNNDVFLFDFGGAGISRLSVKQNGAASSSAQATYATISGDGSTVAYLGQVGGDPYVSSPPTTAFRFHIYRRTVASAATLAMIDVSPDGTTEASASAPQAPPSLSSDGVLIGYLSGAANLMRSSGCTPGCMTFSNPQAWVRDMASPDPQVQRSFLASQIRSKSTSATLPYAASGGGVNSGANSRTISVVGTRDAAWTFYSGQPGGSTDWTQLPAPGGMQVYVSPFSDALFQ